MEPEIVILSSAFKHGVSEQSILSCLRGKTGSKTLDNLPLKQVFAGFDYRGKALEIITVEDEDSGRVVVIHAMPPCKSSISISWRKRK